jgi:hypothetical protein
MLFIYSEIWQCLPYNYRQDLRLVPGGEVCGGVETSSASCVGGECDGTEYWGYEVCWY